MKALRVLGTLGLLFAMCGLARAASVTVENFSFELPGTEKQKGWETVPGWESDTVAVDSGVETGWTPTDGLWTAFLMGSDPSVWQLTDHTIAAGEIFTLDVDARLTWLGTDLTMALYYDDAGSRTAAASQTVTLTDVMADFSLGLVANDVPAAIGKKLGIELKNSTPTGGSWMGLDNVRLSVVPEPSAGILALVALCGIALYGRRRSN